MYSKYLTTCRYSWPRLSCSGGGLSTQFLGHAELFYFMESHLSILWVDSCASGVLFRSPCLCLYLEVFSLCFCLNSFNFQIWPTWSCFLGRVKGVALISFFYGQIVSFSSTMVEQASIPMPVFDDFVRNLGFISGSTITCFCSSTWLCHCGSGLVFEDRYYGTSRSISSAWDCFGKTITCFHINCRIVLFLVLWKMWLEFWWRLP